MLVFLQAPKRYQDGGIFKVHSHTHRMSKFTLNLQQSHVTMIRLYTLTSNLIREAHSVGLELGVLGSYEVELHINNHR